MRIIGGQFKGRRFRPPANNWPTRPTTDFAKEGLFNILNNQFDFESIKVLDLFGGTGSHSYEIISRGCRDVTYVDQYGGCVAFVKQTAKLLDIEDRLQIHRADVFKFLARTTETFHYVFAGPPYALPALDTIPALVFKQDLLRPSGWHVLEHNANHSFRNHPCFLEERHYGGTIFSIFEMPPRRNRN